MCNCTYAHASYTIWSALRRDRARWRGADLLPLMSLTPGARTIHVTRELAGTLLAREEKPRV